MDIGMNRWMDVWMDGWMDIGMNGWMDRWTDKCILPSLYWWSFYFFFSYNFTDFPTSNSLTKCPTNCPTNCSTNGRSFSTGRSRWVATELIGPVIELLVTL